ncbi:myosin, partial [Thraustotheca clavata]
MLSMQQTIYYISTSPPLSCMCNNFSAKPFGLFSLMDEESMLAKGTDASLASKLYLRCSTHPRFSASPVQQGRGLFTVEHYAGKVEYTTEGMREKNKDELRQDIADLFQTETEVHSFTRLLCEAGLTHRQTRSNSPATLRRNESKRLNTSSVGGQFKAQLLHLMEMLQHTSPHYVRCIKPNDSATARVIDRDRVVEQLRCNGVLQAVQVARAGYPVRMLHEEFISRYTIVAKIGKRSGGINSIYAIVDNCLSHLPIQSSKSTSTMDFTSQCVARGIQLGVTKIFMRSPTFERLESLRREFIAVHQQFIGERLLGYFHRRRYVRYRKAVVAIQRAFRYQRQRTACATSLQAFARMVIARTYYIRLVRSVIYLQGCIRAKQQNAKLKYVLEGSNEDEMEDAWLDDIPETTYSELSPISSSGGDDEDIVRMTYVDGPQYGRASA